MAKKDNCPRCSGTLYAIAKDGSNKHYCHTKGCGHVWVPGLDKVQRPAVIIKHLQEENEKLKAEMSRLRKENAELKTQVNELSEMKAAVGQTDEIFS